MVTKNKRKLSKGDRRKKRGVEKGTGHLSNPLSETQLKKTRKQTKQSDRRTKSAASGGLKSFPDLPFELQDEIMGRATGGSMAGLARVASISKKQHPLVRAELDNDDRNNSRFMNSLDHRSRKFDQRYSKWRLPFHDSGVSGDNFIKKQVIKTNRQGNISSEVPGSLASNVNALKRRVGSRTDTTRGLSDFELMGKGRYDANADELSSMLGPADF